MTPNVENEVFNNKKMKNIFLLHVIAYISYIAKQLDPSGFQKKLIYQMTKTIGIIN